MLTINPDVWVSKDVLATMRAVDDTFRGFLRSPDGAVEVEVEALFQGVMSVDFIRVVPQAERKEECCRD